MILDDLVSGVVGLVIAWAATTAVQMYRRMVKRALWRVDDPSRFSIVLATSERIATATYQRPVTGLGQARALAIATTSLTAAYRTPFANAAVLSVHCADERREHDLLLLGGPKNNELTREVLQLLDDRLPYTMHTEGDEVFYYRRGRDLMQLDLPRHDKAGRTWDYGLIIRCPSPYKSESLVTVFAGLHTHGTAAAASFFVSHAKELKRSGSRNYALVVRAISTQTDHVHPPELYRDVVTFQ